MKNYIFLLLITILFFSCSENEVERVFVIPTVIVEHVNVEEFTDTDARLPIQLTNPSDEDITLSITTLSGTAGEQDYGGGTIEVTIPAGETGISVSIGIIDDNTYESTESFTVNYNVISGTITNNLLTSVITIFDDPFDLPTLALNDVTVTEGVDSDAEIFIVLTNPSVEDIELVITTQSQTAGTDDYLETNIIVTIPSLETSTSVFISINDDNLIEGTEMFKAIATIVSGNTENEEATCIVTIIE